MMPMTSKERILCAMRGSTPDRVPVQLGVFSNHRPGQDGKQDGGTRNAKK
jgi:hypothetical protein